MLFYVRYWIWYMYFLSTLMPLESGIKQLVTKQDKSAEVL